VKMRTLLAESGHRLLRNRAECKNCRGGSRWTVSFNSEVAFCHRCQWTANTVTLARNMGKAVPAVSPGKRRALAAVEDFEKWVDAREHEIAARYRCLGRMAELAKDVVIQYPDCEPAWNALSRFYHREAALAGMLDVLSFAKVSPWLEQQPTVLGLFKKWEARCASWRP
jgi:hypothetical protein